MVYISFEIQGAKELSRNLRVLSGSLSNLSQFYKESIDIIKERSDNIFSSAWSIVEKWEKWRALSPNTLNARAKRQWYYRQTPTSGAWPLVWTGNLKNNVTKEITNSYWKLQYNEKYAKFHQSGGGRLPQRKIIDVDNQTGSKIVKALQWEIQRQSPIFLRQL